VKKDWLYTALVVAAVLAYLVWDETTGEGDGVEAATDSNGTESPLNSLYVGTIGAIGAMLNQQSPSQNCFALIKKWEGCRLTAYVDNGSYSIGWGTKPSFAGETITQAEADARMAKCAQVACNEVLKRLKVTLSQNQLDALTDWAYNCEGSKQFPTSSIFTLCNAGNFAAVPAVLLQWNLNNGVRDAQLEARRQDEVNLWDQG